jgi:hypothetical protein
MIFQMATGASLVGTVSALALPNPNAVMTRVHYVTTKSDVVFPAPGVPEMLPNSGTVNLVSVFPCSDTLPFFSRVCGFGPCLVW